MDLAGISDNFLGMEGGGEAQVVGLTDTDLIGSGDVLSGEVLALVLGARITNVIRAAFLCPYP